VTYFLVSVSVSVKPLTFDPHYSS